MLYAFDHHCVTVGYNPSVPTPIVNFVFDSQLPNSIIVSLDMTGGSIEYGSDGLVDFWTYPLTSDKCHMTRGWGVDRFGSGIGGGDIWEICLVGFRC